MFWSIGGTSEINSEILLRPKFSSGKIIERLAEHQASLVTTASGGRKGGTIMRLWHVLQWRWGCNWARLLLCYTTLYKKEHSDTTLETPCITAPLHPFIVPILVCGIRFTLIFQRLPCRFRWLNWRVLFAAVLFQELFHPIVSVLRGFWIRDLFILSPSTMFGTLIQWGPKITSKIKCKR